MNTKIYDKTVMTSIQHQMKYLQDNVSRLLAELTTNVTDKMPWIGQELYETDFRRKLYNDLWSDIQIGHDCASAMAHHVNLLQQWIKRPYNVRENSSGVFHRECSTMRYIVVMEVLKAFQEMHEYAEYEANNTNVE